jgi:hypothetical protein
MGPHCSEEDLRLWVLVDQVAALLTGKKKHGGL